MAQAHILGYPRIGDKRQLKRALERYWQGEISQTQLHAVGAELRHRHWQQQKQAGLDYVTVGDFAWYDHVLATSLLLGVVPKRHRKETIDLQTLFDIARGSQNGCCTAAASDMTKWFNTNYHYLVPEFEQHQKFELSWTQLFDEVEEAQAAGHRVKVSLLGPLTYLWLGRYDGDKLSLLPELLSTYQRLLAKLKQQQVQWVQIEEPILALELPQEWQNAFIPAYQQLHGQCKLLLTTYFDGLGSHWSWLEQLAVDGIHLDLVAGDVDDQQLLGLPRHWVISLGIVNGRNVWAADLAKWLARLSPLQQQLGFRLWLGSSCSLLHAPVDLELETELTDEHRQRFAFAKQKLDELVLLKRALAGESEAIAACQQRSQRLAAKAPAPVPANTQAVESAVRPLSYAERSPQQQLNLPLLPTTTIGSFPQTNAIRATRADFKAGRIAETEYRLQIQSHIAEAIQRQQEIGLDVLVHGEAERNDMVEYFAEHLQGFALTQFGWVQSYGSRCVKPAIVVDNISRPKAITTSWTGYAQSLTDKPVKGMLTGPVTIMAWSFPREDLSRQQITEQIALALREEVGDLQRSGARIIQIDEPAIREGLPLKRSQWGDYLDWAVASFKLAASSALPQTQIHTHMCYSEFNDILPAVAALDADVITIETARSEMALLDAFGEFDYPNGIGPGVYDIHSPNIPSEQAITTLLKKALQHIPAERLWVNPDCGLKTRNWQQTEAALTVMVQAASALRRQLKHEQKA